MTATTSVVPASLIERDRKAREALRVFRRSLRHYEGLASAIAGRKIKIVPSSASATADDIIYLQVPMGLGENHPHDKKLCDKRDPVTKSKLCLACRIKERIHIELMHEIAHIVMGSFEEPDRVARQLMFDIIDDLIKSPALSAQYHDRLEEVLADSNPTYWKMTHAIHEFFQLTLNAIEDVRVNNAMMEARPGTAKMFYALLATGLKVQQDIHGLEKEATWSTSPLNFQIIGALVLTASEFPLMDFSDKIVEDVKDPELANLISKIRSTKSVHEAFALSMPVLRCLNRLGYFQAPEEPELPPEPEEDSEEADDSEDSDQPDEESSSGSSGSTGDENSDDESDGFDDEESNEESDSSGGSSDESDDDGTDDADESDSATGGDSGPDGDDPSDTEGDAETGSDPSSGSSDEGEPNMGTADEVAELYRQFAGHHDISVDGKPAEDSVMESSDEPMSSSQDGEEPDEDGEETQVMRVSGSFADHDEEEELADLRRALAQMDFFDTPSSTIKGVVERRWPEATGPWIDKSNTSSYSNVYECDVEEKLIIPALNKLRVIFTENNARRHERGLKRGRIDSRSLGKRVPVNDPHIFHKRKFPDEKKHAVVIGLDVSGSTGSRGGSTIQLIKMAAFAKAEMLHRLGIDFAVYAHSGAYEDRFYGEVSLDITIVKEFNEPWGPGQRAALKALGPFSANLDGHTLEYYRKAIEKVDANDKWIFYYTDGAMPLENYDEELEILQREIKLCDRLGIRLVGVGVRNDDPTKHGLDTIRIDDISELGKVVDGLRDRLR